MLILLISGSERNSAGYSANEIGQLLVPGDGNTVQEDRVWAIDNGAFSGLDAHLFLTKLRRLQNVPGCRFLAVPDSVGNHLRTLESFWHWESLLRGWPLAFVLQDGCTVGDVPWSHIAAVFVGGSTEFKLGHEAADCVRFAKACGRWVHWGRVNTLRRIRHCLAIGGDSFDGSRFSRFPGERALAVRWVKETKRQPILF